MVGVNLVTLGQIGHRRLLSQRLQSDLRLQRAILLFRLGFFIIRSVYHDGAGFVPTKPLVPKSGSTSGRVPAGPSQDGDEAEDE